MGIDLFQDSPGHPKEQTTNRQQRTDACCAACESAVETDGGATFEQTTDGQMGPVEQWFQERGIYRNDVMMILGVLQLVVVTAAVVKIMGD